jgi:hypothetical protein
MNLPPSLLQRIAMNLPSSRLPGPGNIVYEIRSADQHWNGVGSEVKKEPRMGFVPPGQAKDWMTVDLHVLDLNKAEIPNSGLSLYDETGKASVGEDGTWHLVSCDRAGSIRIVRLSTQHP